MTYHDFKFVLKVSEAHGALVRILTLNEVVEHFNCEQLGMGLVSILAQSNTALRALSQHLHDRDLSKLLGTGICGCRSGAGRLEQTARVLSVQLHFVVGGAHLRTQLGY